MYSDCTGDTVCITHIADSLHELATKRVAGQFTACPFHRDGQKAQQPSCVRIDVVAAPGDRLTCRHRHIRRARCPGIGRTSRKCKLVITCFCRKRTKSSYSPGNINSDGTGSTVCIIRKAVVIIRINSSHGGSTVKFATCPGHRDRHGWRWGGIRTRGATLDARDAAIRWNW